MSLAEALRDAAGSLPAVKLAVLFGSTVRGQEWAESDVDVGVLLEPSTVVTRRDAEVALGRMVSREAGRAVDLVDLETAPPLLRLRVAQHGRLLVERDPGTWVRFKAKAMRDWYDWAPYARRLHRAAIERLRRKVADG